MTAVDARFEMYYLPFLSQLGYQRAILCIEGGSLVVRKQSDDSLIFSSPLDQLRIGTVRYWQLTLLANNETSVRIMFSNPLEMTGAGAGSFGSNGVARAINSSERLQPGHQWLATLPSISGARVDPRMIDPAQRRSDEIQTWFGAGIVGFFVGFGALIATKLIFDINEYNVGFAVATLIVGWVLATIGFQRLVRGWARRQLESPVAY